MSDFIIKVQNLGKRYRIGERYPALRQVAVRGTMLYSAYLGEKAAGNRLL